VDDVVFGAIDVGGGYKSPGKIGVELGKKTAIAAASSGKLNPGQLDRAWEKVLKYSYP
jgi:hypothetical protein